MYHILHLDMLIEQHYEPICAVILVCLQDNVIAPSLVLDDYVEKWRGAVCPSKVSV